MDRHARGEPAREGVDAGFARQVGELLERLAGRLDPLRRRLELCPGELAEGEVPFRGLQAEALEAAMQGLEALVDRRHLDMAQRAVGFLGEKYDRPAERVVEHRRLPAGLTYVNGRSSRLHTNPFRADRPSSRGCELERACPPR